MFKSKLLQRTKIYNHGLPPMLMQNPYSKFILAIKTLIFDRFSKFLQALLRQIETQMLNKNIFPARQQLKKIIIWGQFLHFSIIIFLAYYIVPFFRKMIYFFKHSRFPRTCQLDLTRYRGKLVQTAG